MATSGRIGSLTLSCFSKHVHIQTVDLSSTECFLDTASLILTLKKYIFHD